MEAFTGKPGPYVAGLLAAGLKPETKVHLTVCFQYTYLQQTNHKLVRRGYWTRCR